MALVVFAAQLTLGQSVLQSQVDGSNRESVEKIAEGLLSQGDFGWSLMAVSYGKDT